MVETPAAAYGLPRFRAAFASIGSNDLAQYVMAAARDEAAVAHLARADDPAVLHAVAAAVDGARAAAIPLSICGDAAGDPAVIPHLLAAGLRSLSVAPSAIGRTKRAVASWGAPA
jgi:phosphotransferase system enzyme I (PtsI)